MNDRQNSNIRKERIVAGLKWIGSVCRDLKFGSIRGVIIRDGAMARGAGFRTIRTGKPRPRGLQVNHDKLDGDDVLKDALQDIHRETACCNGEWEIHFKVHKGIPVSWGMEEVGSSSIPENR